MHQVCSEVRRVVTVSDSEFLWQNTDIVTMGEIEYEPDQQHVSRAMFPAP